MTEFKQVNESIESMGVVITWIILIILIVTIVHQAYLLSTGIKEGKKETDDAKWERLKRSAETYSSYHEELSLLRSF